MGSDFEAELETLDARLESALKAVETLVNGLKRTRRAVRDGNASDIVKGLNGLDARIADAQSAASGVSDAWRFDVSAYIADGRFLADLQRAAGEKQLELFERDGRIYCFPLILQLEPGLSAVRVGRKIERRLRPKALVQFSRKRKRARSVFATTPSSNSSGEPIAASSGANGAGPAPAAWSRCPTSTIR